MSYGSDDDDAVVAATPLLPVSAAIRVASERRSVRRADDPVYVANYSDEDEREWAPPLTPGGTCDYARLRERFVRAYGTPGPRGVRPPRA